MSTFKKFAGDKIWVVTGGASGIGLEMVRNIAGAHGVVWALDRDVAALAQLSAEAGRQGWDVFTRAVDVTDMSAIQNVLQEMKQQSKRVNVWINNAGVQRIGGFSATSEQDFDLVMQVNLNAVIAITRKLVQLMEDQGGGVILNMASVAGHVPAPFMTAYVASKYGVIGFSRALQAEFELLRSPVRVAFASPGFVNTAIIDRGREQGFPEWLSWLLSDPKACARDILSALARGENEIHPTVSGAMMRAAYAVMPRTTVRSSKMLLTRGFKDFLMNRYQVPR